MLGTESTRFGMFTPNFCNVPSTRLRIADVRKLPRTGEITGIFSTISGTTVFLRKGEKV